MATETYPQLIRDFATRHEIDALRVPKTWHRSVVLGSEGAFEDPMRTSSQSVLRDRRVVAMLTDRLRTHGIVATYEEGSWVKYERGERYAVHGDAAGMRRGRAWTLLLCVRGADAGGETQFPHLDKRFALACGDALVWPNYSDGVDDERMDHEALPPTQGTKIVINAWFS